MTKKQRKVLIRIIITAVLVIVLHFAYEAFGEGEDARIPSLYWAFIYLIPYFIIGWDILRKSLKGILNRQVFDENFLMSVATIGAFAIALYEGSGEYSEAVMVMLLYQIGELFQSYAVGKSRKNISELMDIRPDYANIEEDGELKKVDPDEVVPGTVIVVRPGEKIPIDGVIVEGDSSLNTSALTGESRPRDVMCGDEVISGCINMTGVIKIKTEKEFGESTVSKILELVENSSSQKSSSENFITKFAKYYTPVVCICALTLALLPPLVLLILGKDPVWSSWVYRALTFLVISCPCALVISIPLSFFAGIGGASREGILVKGSNYLEALSKTGIVAFDKTGTMTMGIFEVSAIHHGAIEHCSLLDLAAHAECFSSHPISRSIQKAWLDGLVWQIDPVSGAALPVKNNDAPDSERHIVRERVSSVKELPGGGISAIVDDKKMLLGNARLMSENGIAYKECEDDHGTVVHVAIDGEYVGHLVISDVIKPGSAEAIASLKNSGIHRTVMLTGDAKNVAEEVAEKIGIDDVHYELLPEDKVSYVEKLLKEKKGNELLAFVGDGINDAPVLSRADIGIAMGALGSDAAIEAADIVLMDDDPRKISKAIRISRKCMRIVYENIWFAIGIKFICLILGALGFANMWLAIFADTGVMVLAVLNSIRALFVRRL